MFKNLCFPGFIDVEVKSFYLFPQVSTSTENIFKEDTGTQQFSFESRREDVLWEKKKRHSQSLIGLSRVEKRCL
jgi:hypothetical protein